MGPRLRFRLVRARARFLFLRRFGGGGKFHRADEETGEEAGQDVKALGEMERDYILEVLQKTGWRIEGKDGAALVVGLNASTLRGRMRKYGIRR